MKLSMKNDAINWEKARVPEEKHAAQSSENEAYTSFTYLITLFVKHLNTWTPLPKKALEKQSVEKNSSIFVDLWPLRVAKWSLQAAILKPN